MTAAARHARTGGPRGPRGPRVLGAALAAVLLLAGPASAPRAADGPGPVAAALLRHVEGLGVAGLGPVNLAPALEAAALSAYEARDWRPIWLPAGEAAGGASRDRLAAVLDVLGDAAREGLRPQAYAVSAGAEELDAFLAGADAAARAALDVEVTAAALAYARDAATGRLDPQARDPGVFAVEKSFDAAAALAVFADPARDVARYLRGLSPDHAEYAGLRQGLARYRAIAAREAPPPVPDGPPLKPGMRDPRVAAVRARLAHLGEISIPAADPAHFTPALTLAVESFQRRHGLDTDGVVGAQTRAALNVSAAERAAQIRLNMERWRWLPDDLGARYVLVNIAGFEVAMVADGGVADRMRAVVGRPYRMTPVFSDRISYIEINPSWTVPPRIARRDLLPKIQADPTFLAAGGYEVYSGWGADAGRVDPAGVAWAELTAESFPYKLRQRPGPENALGAVKVMFPNRFNVYLHDTPARELFAARVRAFSSGCIRLQRPFDLVAWLMRETGGPEPAAIAAMRESGATRIVKLRETVSVHLIYATVWAGEDGAVHFREDIYGRDARLAERLAGA